MPRRPPPSSPGTDGRGYPGEGTAVLTERGRTLRTERGRLMCRQRGRQHSFAQADTAVSDARERSACHLSQALAIIEEIERHVASREAPRPRPSNARTKRSRCSRVTASKDPVRTHRSPRSRHRPPEETGPRIPTAPRCSAIVNGPSAYDVGVSRDKRRHRAVRLTGVVSHGPRCLRHRRGLLSMRDLGRQKRPSECGGEIETQTSRVEREPVTVRRTCSEPAPFP